jgi:hypothetical protein
MKFARRSLAIAVCLGQSGIVVVVGDAAFVPGATAPRPVARRLSTTGLAAATAAVAARKKLVPPKSAEEIMKRAGETKELYDKSVQNTYG